MMRAAVSTLALCLVLGAPGDGDARRRARGAQRVAIVPLSANGQGAEQVAGGAARAIVSSLRAQRREVRLLDGGRASRLRLCMQQPRCARAVAAKLGATVLLTGHVERDGDAFHVDLQAVSALSGRVVANEALKLTSTRDQSPASRVALRLLAQAGKATEAAPEEDKEPPLSKSDAEYAAAIIEQGDGEDPLASKARPASGPASRTAGSEETPPVEPRRPRTFGQRWWPTLTLGALGIAAMGTGIGFGVVCNLAVTQGRETTSQYEARNQLDKARQNALVANILYGVGGAALLTSAVLFIVELRAGRVEEKRARVPQLGLGPGPGGALLTARGEF